MAEPKRQTNEGEADTESPRGREEQGRSPGAAKTATDLGSIVQLFTFGSALGMLSVGIIQVVDLFEALQVCGVNGNTNKCVGSLLNWTGSTTVYNSQLNGQWRGVFSFSPSIFVENWTPLIFGIVAILQLFAETRWAFVSSRWLRCMLFHAIMGLFACFPYAGQGGIVVGFAVVFTAFMCMVCEALADKTPCYRTLKIPSF